ncbi:hypothetical protein GIB67_034148 [Kingdonia uniflora]|uniref:Uncharacterized protein n=1 Tax=Kingdonia uniflora TaxID=39325 RepID=A0A7J7P4P1_9MAGN|nr:hypothetical protein GIB67_034148 [Kingdonia uniflora]
MIPGKQGCILINGRVSTVTGGYAYQVYATSKHAIIGLMKNTAAILGQFGIRVNCIYSFVVVTIMATDYFPDKDVKWIEDYACKISNLEGAVLTADDVAKAVVYFWERRLQIYQWTQFYN